MRWIRWAIAMGAALAVGCAEPGKKPAGANVERATDRVFTDVTTTAGIMHTHHKPILDHKLDNIMSWVSSVGAAACAGDFDNDGWLDLYVTDSDKGKPNYLYHNNHDGTFTDVARAAGVADLNGEHGVSMDCLWGDYDNDGWIDLFVARWGYNALFHNNGNGASPQFTDVTEKLFRKRDGSPGTQWANTCAAIFWDYDKDGRLDIYIGNYFQEIDLWHLESTRIMHDDFEHARNAGENYLYRQEPDGTFKEVAKQVGLEDPGWTLAVGSADVNNDGWADLYCADDFGPDQLFINLGDGKFRNDSAVAIGSDTRKGMNAEFGDFNNDGWLDIYVANITTAEYLQEGNMLWRNNGPNADGLVTFTDVALETGTYDGGWGWGAKFFDYDNDGDLDIYAANGFISAGEGNYWYDLASWTVLGQDTAEAKNWPTIGDRSFSGYEPDRFWRNDGFDSFSLRAAEVGVDNRRDGRGVVCFDYDNDGDVDLFVANQGQPPNLFRNDGKAVNHWLTLALEVDLATGVNRDAIGARVTVVTDNGTQIRERDGGNGYCGQSDPRLHVGLGGVAAVKLIEVRWPDGGLQYWENVRADQFMTLRQEPSRYATDAMVAVAPPRASAGRPATREESPPPEPADLNQTLSDMESRIMSEPDRYSLADSYRQLCVTFKKHDRSIEFFEKLAGVVPSSSVVAIELSAAYVDKIPTCGGIAAVVSKGTLARKGLDVLDKLIAGQGGSWAAYYARGMNHLHWPRSLLHSDDAVADLTRCLEMQRAGGAPDAKSYYERIYIILGDAHTKDKSYEAARKVWREGLAVFANSEPLKARLAVTDDGQLLKMIEKECGLEKPIDTGFGFLEREP